MERTKNDVLFSTTQLYLDKLDIANPPDADIIEAQLLELIRFEFELENAVKPRGRHWRIPTELENFMIAEIILRLNHVRRLLWAGTEQDNNYDLVMYQPNGDHVGVYTKDPVLVKNLIRCYNRQISDRAINEVLSILCDRAILCRMADDSDLIAVNNGIFNYTTKQLQPFSPDHVFVSKSGVDYNPLAVSPVIHNELDKTRWDVESWVASLSDDKEIRELLWQVIGAIIRPNISWNRVVCFYSEQGNNGKGTLCALMRNLCGESSCSSIPFADFAREFMLEQLTHISAIITDENDTNDFTKVAASLKAVITADYLTINRKFQKPITIRFRGVMVQCINDLPKFGDRSDSLYRRFLLVPFTKCFTGVERKYIKNDYLNRQDVLEYVLFKVLHMDYNEFSEPEACLKLMAEYKEFNDPIRQFLGETLDALVWDLVPYPFLYDLYVAWCKRNNPSGSVTKKGQVIKQIKQVLKNDENWSIDIETAISVNAHMNKAEPLIGEYNLTHWTNKDYKGNDNSKIGMPSNLATTYRGMKRR